MTRIRKLVFLGIALSPLLAIFTVAIYIMLFTNFIKLFYTEAIRNIYFDCVEFVPFNTVYNLYEGECKLENLEYDTIIHSDSNGYRNSIVPQSPELIVLGDSHAHGFGVNDKQTFARLLSDQYAIPTTNLGMGSYDTVRALEAFVRFSSTENYVVIQYCSNDVDGNAYYNEHGIQQYLATARKNWTVIAKDYNTRKEMGVKAVILGGIDSLLRAQSNSAFYAQHHRNIEREAKEFVAVLGDYAERFEGKHVIIFESSEWGLNHPQFQEAFTNALTRAELDLDVSVLDSSHWLRHSDYYFLDDHLNPQGHAAIAQKISQLIRSDKNDDSID